MVRKLVNQEKFQEGELVEAWSKTRIYVALGVVLILVFVGLYGYAFFTENILPQTTSVLGTTDVRQGNSTEVKLPNKEDVSNILEQAKENLSEITSENLTSSQAAIQKIIQDLQSIQNGSGSAVGVFCDMVCKR